MGFTPAFCPCGSHESFQYQRRGTYTRACDGRAVQRFLCKQCGKSFSTQTFAGDYRQKDSRLDVPIFVAYVSCVSQRQTARSLHCNRKRVVRRLLRFSEQCRAFHDARVKLLERSGISSGLFLLDELETFEHNRRLKPVTVPVLVHKPSHCVLHTAVGTLPPRRPLRERDKPKLEALEKAGEKRTSQSREKVAECFDVLARVVPKSGTVHVRTDQKHTYAALLKQRFGERLVHRTTNSQEPRTYLNPLFVVNHTLAMLRDGLSRLRRRSWCASKLRERLQRHLWVWIAWRNYVRPITNLNHEQTPGMVAGLIERMLDIPELTALRAFPLRDAHSKGPESPNAQPRT